MDLVHFDGVKDQRLLCGVRLQWTCVRRIVPYFVLDRDRAHAQLLIFADAVLDPNAIAQFNFGIRCANFGHLELYTQNQSQISHIKHEYVWIRNPRSHT